MRVLLVEDDPMIAQGLQTALRQDGYAVDRVSDGRSDSTPVIIVTARDDLKNRIEGLDAGADDYIIKPFDLDEVSARMRSVLRRAAGRGDPCIIRFAPGC